MKIKKQLMIFLFLSLLYINISAIDAVLIRSIDRYYIDKWHRTESESTPVMNNVERVYKNQSVTVYFAVSKYTPDKNKTVHITCDIEMTDPKNKQYFKYDNIELINAKFDNPEELIISTGAISVIFEDKDLYGKYKIKAVLKDANDGTTKEILSDITVKEYKPGKYLFNEKTFTAWMSNYYTDPEPDKAIDAYIFYAKSKLNEANNSFIPIFSFFLEVFNSNDFIVPPIRDIYKKQILKTKIYIIYLLRYMKGGNKDFLEKLEGDEKKVYDKIIGQSLPDFTQKITDPSQLDMLWGTFFASGSYIVIQKIVSALENVKFKGNLDKYKSSGTKDEKIPDEVMNDLIYQTARWSIKSNCEQHKLVMDYCSYILANDKLAEPVKSELGAILESLKGGEVGGFLKNKRHIMI